MARVQLVQKAQAPPEVRELYQKMEANGAKILNLYRTLAHNPEVMRNFLRLGNSLLSRTELSSKLRELAILLIARLTGSEYEWAQHYAIALEAGVSREQAETVMQWKSSANFNDEERAVLKYTDEVARNMAVAERTFAELRRYLSERSIVELTVAIGYWGMVARLLVSLEVDLDAQSVGSVGEIIGGRG